MVCSCVACVHAWVEEIAEICVFFLVKVLVFHLFACLRLFVLYYHSDICFDKCTNRRNWYVCRAVDFMCNGRFFAVLAQPCFANSFSKLKGMLKQRPMRVLLLKIMLKQRPMRVLLLRRRAKTRPMRVLPLRKRPTLLSARKC
jgi:hypothetical protein